jgi:RsiW-degrading membrane proteinase PrsW (M82 family)
MLIQLLAGGAVSFFNFGIHALVTGLIVVATRHTARKTDHMSVFSRITALLTVTVAALMVAHVGEIAVWTVFYIVAGVVDPARVHPFEFAFENYTALGYGDFVPSDWRLIGPITALNGLLLIGWSVAIIFEVLRMAEVQIGRHHKPTR